MKTVLTISLVVVAILWLIFPEEKSYLRINELSSKLGVFKSAHRTGNGRLGIENTVKSISKCIELGIDIIEIDLFRSKDGVYYVFHDKSFEVTTDIEDKFPPRPGTFIKKNGGTMDLLYPVTHYESEEIETLNLRVRTKNEGEIGAVGPVTNFRIPTLEEILSITKNKILIRLDKWDDKIRGNDPMEIVRLIAKYDMFDQTLISGKYSVDEMKKIFGEDYSKISFMPFISSKDSEEKVNEWRNANHGVTVSGYRFKIDDENDMKVIDYMSQIRDQDKKCIYIAANVGEQSAHKGDNERGWKWMWKYADFVETDYPEEMFQYIKKQNLCTDKMFCKSLPSTTFLPFL
jgi:glycerophosphoryl diester phosphodiesterase